MILADKIIEQRKKLGLSQEELASMMDVSRQSVSKWESAQSTPDLNKIIALSKIFDVSTDYLIKDEIEDITEVPAEAQDESIKKYRKISLQDAHDILATHKKAAKSIALGVMLCILGVIPTLILGTFAEEGKIPLSEDMAGGIGVAILLVFVAIATALFVLHGIKLSKFEFIEKGEFETEYGVTGLIKEKKAAFSEVFIRNIVLGVVTIIIGVIPMIVIGVIGDSQGSDAIASIGVAVLLLMAAIGTYPLITAGMTNSLYDQLLKEGDYTAENRKKNKKLEGFAGVYWCTVTAFFLGYSFITEDWGHSWIIWAVAGVLFGGIAAAISSKANKDN